MDGAPSQQALIWSDALLSGRLCYGEADAVSNTIGTHERNDDFDDP